MRKTAVKVFFPSRKKEIKKRLVELKSEKERIEITRRALEKELKDFEIKKEEIIEQFRAEGRAEKQKIIAEARERTKEILAQADSTIQEEIGEARERLRKDLCNVSAQGRREIVAKGKRQGQRDQDHMIKEFIKKVEKLH